MTVANTPSRSWRGARGTALWRADGQWLQAVAHTSSNCPQEANLSSGEDSTNARSVALSENPLARSRASSVRRFRPFAHP